MRPQSAATNFLKPGSTSKQNSNPIVSEESDLEFEAKKLNNEPAHSFFLSQA